MLLHSVVLAQFSDDECSACHELTVTASIHEGLECVDCHGAIAELPHADSLPAPACAQCHEAVVEEYDESIHAIAQQQGLPEAARCWDCHAGHRTLPTSDPESRLHPAQQAKTCGRCHGQPALAEEYGIPIKNPYDLYEKSVHAYQISLGNYDAATCTSCHGAHNIKALADPTSSIYGGNVPQTCAQCHQQEGEEYAASIHWEAFRKGLRRAPVCNDCHLEHAILPPSTPESPVSHFQVPTTCAGCHANEQIIRRYGLAAFRVESFYSSYHGLALRGGGAEVANCSSCHGPHEIRTAADSLSTIHPANLPQTCGTCHPGIGAEVIIGTIHGPPSGAGGKVIAFVRGLYIWIIVLVVTGIIIHNGLDFRTKVKARKRYLPEPPGMGREVLRFNTVERTLHWLIMIPFIILAWSGFGLAYPDSFWGALWAEDLRRLVHRAGATILLGAIVVQFILIAATRRGRSQIKALRPRLKDLQDAWLMFRYFVGRSPRRPAFNRFSYMEKFEYWAVIWGMVIMAITGLGLWFENQMLQLAPKWWLDLFTVIHFYEALLASLAILFWHFYWVIFDPHVYPGSGVFWHGKIPVDRFKTEHPLEWEKIKGDFQR